MKLFKSTLSLAIALLILISMTSVVIVGAKDAELADVGAWNTSYTSKLNGDPFNDITEIALAQEYKTASDLDLSGQWCAKFVSECAAIAGQSAAIPYNASVVGMYDAVKKAGGFEVSSPQKGDLVFFHNGNTSKLGHVAFATDGTHNVSGNIAYNGTTPSKVYILKNSSEGYSNWFYVRPNYSSNSPHTHSYDTYVYYQDSHPHYKCYQCSCGAIKENTSETVRVDECDQCNPGKPTVSVITGTSAEYTQFSWDYVNNADYYEIKIEQIGNPTPIIWEFNLIENGYQAKLPPGDYAAYVIAINSAYVNTNRWWTVSDTTYFTVKEGTFFSVESITYNGNKYELFDITMPWTEAKAKCEELGGHLVTFSSNEESEAINSLVSKGNRSGYWIGYTDIGHEGSWYSVTGEAIAYTNWDTEQPDDYWGIEDCALIKAYGKKWNDVSNMIGEFAVGFICEYEGKEDECIHAYNVIDETPAGCASQGSITYECEKCGNVYSEVLAPTGIHNYYIIEEAEPCCQSYGYTKYECECGDVYTETGTELGDHVASDEWTVLKVPTETTYGFACKLCTLCNTQMEYATIDINGNIVSSNDKPSTEPQPPIHDQPLGYEMDAYIVDENTGDVMFNWSAHSGAAYYNIRILNSDHQEIVNEIVEEPYYLWSPITSEHGMLSVASYDANGKKFAESTLVTYDISLIAMGDWWGEYGDVDCSGKVNIKDATLIQKYLAKLSDIDDAGLGAADVNSDEKINVKDATAIQKYLANISTDTKVGEFYHYAFTDYEITLIK